MPDARGQLPPFPVPETLNAPPSWRCIDFISDLHLHEELPRTTKALADYLASTPADAVLMLGDIFEAWVGDDMRSQPYEAACTRFLAEAGRRLYLGMMVGNRDFLLGSEMLASCNGHRLGDPTVLHAFNQTLLLIHGDELCLADADYLRFRQQVRNPAWQQAFLSHPLDVRLAQARQMREASHMKQQTQAAETWADVDEPAAAQWMQAMGASALIHGHTHHPSDQPFALPGAKRHVLSDWDLDHGTPRAQVLRLSAHGFERMPLTS
jgi:UDP-2,3-diacylglucosamine hydrolase